jgi:hypothetical protein
MSGGIKFDYKFAISQLVVTFALITPPCSLCTADLLLLGAFFL